MRITPETVDPSRRDLPPKPEPFRPHICGWCDGTGALAGLRETSGRVDTAWLPCPACEGFGMLFEGATDRCRVHRLPFTASPRGCPFCRIGKLDAKLNAQREANGLPRSDGAHAQKGGGE